MPELDRVIYDIERCIYPDPQTCWDCSKYKKGMPLPDCVNELLADALELLKEQEPVCVKESKIDKCVCGNIVNRYYHPKFCGYCGKKLMWVCEVS